MHRTLNRSFAAAALVAACGKAPPPAQPTNSGSIGIVIVTVAGKQQQRLFLPQQQLDANGQPSIAILDAAYTGSSAPLLGSVELTGHTDGSFATATAASASVVVAVGAQSPFVDFIDPVAGTVQATVQLPQSLVQLLQLGNASSFSGGGGVATGVVIDTAGGRAWIAVPTGFLPVDLATHQFGTLISTAPSENFGFWPAKGWILAPFYDCPNCPNAMPAAGFQLVDVAKGKSFLLTGGSGNPVGTEPDSADIDPTTGLAVVPDESSGTTFTVNLNAATEDDSAGTVTAPLGQAPVSVVGYTGVAVEPTSHRALLEQEFSTGVALVTLAQSGSASAANPSTAVTADIPPPGGGAGWTNSGDPHGIAVTVGLVSGKPVGFLVAQDASTVARIDLDGFASARQTHGAVAPIDFDPLVTFIPAHN